MTTQYTEALLRVLEGGNYNAVPGRLRPGCVFWAVDPTPHMEDLAEIAGYGKLSFDYPPSPEDCARHNEKPRTPEEIEEVRLALIKGKVW